MPEAMSLQNPRRTLGMSEGTNSPGLLNMKVGAAYKSLVQMMNDLWLLTLASALSGSFSGLRLSVAPVQS